MIDQTFTELILFRHGVAIEREHPKCPPDPDRFLTKKGIRRTHAAARGLGALGVAPDRIISSPYRRALETAIIAAEELGFDPDRIEESDALLFAADPREILALVRSSEAPQTLITGHAPHLDEVILTALSARNELGIKLKKAGAACLELSQHGPSKLRYLLEPRALRALGRL